MVGSGRGSAANAARSWAFFCTSICIANHRPEVTTPISMSLMIIFNFDPLGVLFNETADQFNTASFYSGASATGHTRLVEPLLTWLDAVPRNSGGGALAFEQTDNGPGAQGRKRAAENGQWTEFDHLVASFGDHGAESANHDAKATNIRKSTHRVDHDQP